MTLRRHANRVSVRLQALMRAFEPDRLADRFGALNVDEPASRDERVLSARSIVRALLRQEGR